MKNKIFIVLICLMGFVISYCNAETVIRKKDSYGGGYSEIPYIDGKKDGIGKFYDKDGRLDQESSFKNGRKEGIEKLYDKNGKVISERIWKDGEIAILENHDNQDNSVNESVSAEVKKNIQALDSWDIKEKLSAIEKLGKSHGRDPSVVRILIGMLGDEAGYRESPWFTDESTKVVGEYAAHALISIRDAKSVEPLINVLSKDKNPFARKNAAYVLGYMHDPIAAQALIAALKDNDAKVRNSALWALDTLKDIRAVGALVALIYQKDEGIDKVQIITVLGNLGNGAAVEPLTTILRSDNDDRAKEESLRSLSKIKDSRATEAIISMLNDKNPNIRGEAVYALGEIRDPRARKPLLAIIEDTDSMVRGAAICALGKIGPDTLKPDSSTEEALIAALKENNEFTRKSAVDGLGRINNACVIEVLISALKDESGLVRESAVENLGNLKNKLAVEPLIGALNDEDRNVRIAVANALIKLNDPRAVEPLIARLNDNDAGVRGRVCIALANLNDKCAVEPLIVLYRKETDPWVRTDIKQALARLKDPRAKDFFIEGPGSSYEIVQNTFQIESGWKNK